MQLLITDAKIIQLITSLGDLIQWSVSISRQYAAKLEPRFEDAYFLIIHLSLHWYELQYKLLWLLSLSDYMTKVFSWLWYPPTMETYSRVSKYFKFINIL